MTATIENEYSEMVTANAATVTPAEQQLALEVAQRWCHRYRRDLTPAVRAPWNGAGNAFRSVGARYPSARLAGLEADDPRGPMLPADIDPARADAIADWCHLRYQQLPERVCEKCGCTDDDCISCVERTGHPCHWIADNVCSACVPVDARYHPAVTVTAAREVLGDIRKRVAVAGCSRLTAAVILQEYVAEWIADRVIEHGTVGPDLEDLYVAAKAVLRNETRRAVHRQRGAHARLVEDIARAAATAGRAADLEADGQ